MNNSFLGDKKGTRDKIWVNTHDDLYSTIKEAGVKTRRLCVLIWHQQTKQGAYLILEKTRQHL